MYYRLVLRISPDDKKPEQDALEGVTDASAPQAADDIVLFSSETNGTRLRKIIYTSTSATVLPLDGGSGTAIRSLEPDQWGGVYS